MLPDNGIVARISGDEFAMVISDCDNDEWLEYILDQVQDEISRPVMIGRRELFASLSMGAAIGPKDGKNPDELLRKADIALYDAKANGRNRRSFFEPTMEQHVQSKDFVSDMNGNPEAEAILVSIIQLGKALGMTIVAEGIETIDQIRFLQAHDCHRMQGYFISRPLTSTALSQFLENFQAITAGELPDGFELQAQSAKG